MLKFHPKKKEMLKWVKEMRFYNTNFHFIWFNFKYPELKKLRMQRSSPWFRWECLLSQWILLSLCWNGSTLSVPFSLSLSISIKNWHPLNTQIWDWSSQQEFPSTVIHSPESVYAWIKKKKKTQSYITHPPLRKWRKIIYILILSLETHKEMLLQTSLSHISRTYTSLILTSDWDSSTFPACMQDFTCTS